MSWDFEKGLQLIIKALEKTNEEKVWQRWLSIYPYMVIGPLKFTPFDEYLDSLLVPKTNKVELTKEQIIKKAEAIRARDTNRNIPQKEGG